MQYQVKVIFEYLQGIWLKRKYIVIYALLLCPIGWLGVTLLPNEYTSEAKVYADTQSILRPLLRGLAIQTDPSHRLNLMAKTLLNTRNLETIANEVDGNIIAKTKAEYDEILEELESNIRIQESGRANLYRISYTGSDPVYARNVVQAALNVFIESTLGDKRLDAEEANDVINDQIDYYEERLIKAEKELADFKRKYIGLLPGSDKSYYSNLERQKVSLEEAEMALQEAESSLNKATDQLEVQKLESLSLLSQIQTDYDKRIEAVEIRLDDLLFRYTDKHPDVIETKRQLEELLKLKEAAVREVSIEDILNDNVVYQNLKIAINQLNNEIASLEVRVDRHRSRITELQSKLDVVPDVEAMLTSLTRNYDITKSKYEELLSRGESASISQSVGSSSEDIKFKIIEQPKIPTAPSGPNRIFLLFVVTVVGLGIGISVSFIVSQVNPVAFSSNQLYRMTGIPVFGVISATPNSKLLKMKTRSLVKFCFLSVVIIAGFIASIAINLDESLYSSVRDNVMSLL